MMGRGQNRGEIFIFVVTPRPGLDPRTFRMPSEPHPRQAKTVSYSWAQYIAPSICILLIYVIKNWTSMRQQKCPFVGILLDMVGLGL